jgi:hypothetical protein
VVIPSTVCVTLACSGMASATDAAARSLRTVCRASARSLGRLSFARTILWARCITIELDTLLVSLISLQPMLELATHVVTQSHSWKKLFGLPKNPFQP